MAGSEKILCGSPSAMYGTIFSSTTITSTTSGARIPGVERYTTGLFLAQLSSVTGTSPTFDVYIQTLLPDNTTWQDIAHFSQMTGTANRIIWFVTGSSTEAAVQTAALSAGTIKSIGMGGAIRATCVVGGTNPSGTLLVTCSLFE